MRSVLLLSYLLWCWLAAAGAQTLAASASPSTVEHLGYVRVVYEVDDATATDFEAPDFAPFRVIGGASRQSSTTIVNGRASYSSRISYDLLAEEVGRHEIPPASIRVDGRRIRSNPLVIAVAPGAGAATDADLADREVFAATVLSADTVYLGERLLIISELLNRVDIRTYSLLSVLDLDHLQTDKLRRLGGYPRRRNVGGRDYQVTRLQVLDAHATRVGTFDLGTQVFDVGVVREGAPRRGFFFGPRTESRRVVAAPVSLTVLPLPGGAPDDFTGAVGEWGFTGRFTGGTEVTTDDAIAFEFTARGRGDVTRLTAPAFEWPEGWRALPPELVQEESIETDIGLTFTRRFRYPLVPEAPGRYELRPTLSYFDTQTERYERWRATPATVTVTGDAIDAGVGASGSTDGGLPLPAGEPRVLRGFWVTHGWYWALLGLMGAAVAAAAVWRVLRKRDRNRPTAPADPLAEGRARLAEARAHLDDEAAFYPAVLTALERYGEDRLGLGKSEQTGEGVRAAFAKTGRAEAAEGFLRARALADRGRYGGGVDRAGREAAVAELERVLSS